MSDEEREERYEEENTEKKPRTHKNITTDYDGAATLHLNNLNKWIISQGYTPKFNSLAEYKEVVKLGSEKVYN